jgi:signal transduction histidine kinase
MASTAMLYFDSCLLLSETTHDLNRKKETLREIYTYFKEAGRHRKALNTLVRYHEVSDSIFNIEKAEIISELMLKYEKEKDRLRILRLENENLQRLKQRNLIIFAASGVFILAILLLAFLQYKNRKNRIIAGQRIRQLEEEKKHMAARFLVEGQEKERKRVALELHDNLGVLLSATKMQFTEVSDSSPENRQVIEKAKKLLEQASTDVRKISHNLMPGLLTKLGLFEALEDLFEMLKDTEGIDAVLEIIGPRGRLPENSEIMLYRMFQEMVNNTIKHAGAGKADLTIIINSDEMQISYSDNGSGFDVEETLGKKTMGMQSILSRIRFLDGHINIDSSRDAGTVYRISIPLGTSHYQSSEEG